MSYETGAYDNEHRDPVVVLVVTGTHDVSRIVNLLAGGHALSEHTGLSKQVRRQVNRHGGGRAAMRLLVEHGGPNLLQPAGEVDVLDDVARWLRSLSATRAGDLGETLSNLAQRLERVAGTGGGS